MNRIGRYLLGGAVMLWMAPALAGGDTTAGCEETADPASCWQGVYLEADGALNRAYYEVMLRLQDTGRLEQKGLLRQAERDWIAYRDDECEFRASGTHGDSTYVVVLTQCLTDLTRKRTDDLLGYLSCVEGNPSCPTW